MPGLRRGYYLGDVNGVYGDMTVKAVERYQRAGNLQVDCRTGTKFTCYHMEGSSHIDAEPLTPYDTPSL